MKQSLGEKDIRSQSSEICRNKWLKSGLPRSTTVKKQNGHHHSSASQYQCKLCSKSYRRVDNLCVHVKAIHTKDVTYVCQLCDFITLRRSSLRAHQKSHEKSTIECICPICGSSFKTKAIFKYHLLYHADVCAFSCDECGKKFTLANRLRAHKMQVHGPKNFECTQCQKRFSTIHQLNRHILIHIGDKPFACCYCPYSSNTQGNLVKHVKLVHGKIRETFKEIMEKKSGNDSNPETLKNPAHYEEVMAKGRDIAESFLKDLAERGISNTTLGKLQEKKKIEDLAKLSQINKQLSRNPRGAKSERKSTQHGSSKKNSEVSSSLLESKIVGNDFILPRMEEVPDNDCTVILPTTRTIQVTWNNDDLMNAEVVPVSGTNSNAASMKSTKMRKLINAGLAEHYIIDENGHLNPSVKTLEERELKFNISDGLLTENQVIHAHSSGLVPTLENQLHCVDSYVDFSDNIETSSALVNAAVEFDKPDKISDIYSQLLPVSDEAQQLIIPYEISQTQVTESSRTKGHHRQLKQKNKSSCLGVKRSFIIYNCKSKKNKNAVKPKKLLRAESNRREKNPKLNISNELGSTENEPCLSKEYSKLTCSRSKKVEKSAEIPVCKVFTDSLPNKKLFLSSEPSAQVVEVYNLSRFKHDDICTHENLRNKDLYFKLKILPSQEETVSNNEVIHSCSDYPDASSTSLSTHNSRFTCKSNTTNDLCKPNRQLRNSLAPIPYEDLKTSCNTLPLDHITTQRDHSSSNSSHPDQKISSENCTVNLNAASPKYFKPKHAYVERRNNEQTSVLNANHKTLVNFDKLISNSRSVHLKVPSGTDNSVSKFCSFPSTSDDFASELPSDLQNCPSESVRYPAQCQHVVIEDYCNASAPIVRVCNEDEDTDYTFQNITITNKADCPDHVNSEVYVESIAEFEEQSNSEVTLYIENC